MSNIWVSQRLIYKNKHFGMGGGGGQALMDVFYSLYFCDSSVSRVTKKCRKAY